MPLTDEARFCAQPALAVPKSNELLSSISLVARLQQHIR